MKISSTNNAAVIWRENSGSRPVSTSVQRSTDKVQEIASSGGLLNDERAKSAGTRKPLSITDTSTHSLAGSNDSSTYKKITYQHASAAKATYAQSPYTRALHSKTLTSQAVPQRRESDLPQGMFVQENPHNSGFAGTVNNRLHQTAISTYRSHQLLERRDQFIASVGIREIA